MIENQRDEMRREFEGRLDDQREDDMQAVRQLALEYGRPGEEPLVAHVKSKTRRQVQREKTPSFAKVSSDLTQEVSTSARKMTVGPVFEFATAFAIDVCKQSDCKYATKSVSTLESPVMFSTVSAEC